MRHHATTTINSNVRFVGIVVISPDFKRTNANALICPTTQGPKETTMKHGDYVKVIGRDGFYVFLKELQGTATLRVGSAKSPDTPTLAIAMSRVVSLEKTE